MLLLKYSECMYECNLERKKGEKIQFEKPTKLSNLSHRETTEKSPRYNFHPTEFHVFNQADQRRNATRREENPLDKQKEFRIFSKLVTAPFNRHFPLFLVNDAPPIFFFSSLFTDLFYFLSSRYPRSRSRSLSRPIVERLPSLQHFLALPFAINRLYNNSFS